MRCARPVCFPRADSWAFPSYAAPEASLVSRAGRDRGGAGRLPSPDYPTAARAVLRVRGQRMPKLQFRSLHWTPA